VAATVELSRADARRIALRAQGFGSPRPKRVTKKHLLRVLDQVGGVQIDAVNVLTRAHFFPFFSRLGPYDPALLHDLMAPGGGVVEYWMSGTCLMPYERWPLLAWKMRESRIRLDDDGMAALASLQREVDLRGEVTAAELEERTKPKEPWWDWTATKRRLEYLLWTGQITAGRRGNFERTYLSLFEVFPDEIVAARDAIDTEESLRACVLLMAHALGVATAHDVCNFLWMKRAVGKRVLNELVAEGVLVAARVEGVKDLCYSPPAALKAKPVHAAALVNPFDPFMNSRRRIRDMFGFDYILEIYVPEAKRQYGYYVLPFLLGEQFVARVDLKADRKGRALLVQASYAEFGVDLAEVADALAHELRELARWQGLSDVVLKTKGDFAKPLAAAVG
jgi:uncharacterized protein